jgi:hypothetical protein
MPFQVSSCDCNGGTIPNVVQCKTCVSGGISDTIRSPLWIEANQRVIQNQVRATSSQYVGTLAAMTVRGPFTGVNNNNPIPANADVNWNQSSDRARAGVMKLFVPTRGNSTKTTITRCRPNATAPGGEGVDVKHNSYARFLNRKKAGVLRQQPKNNYPQTDAERAYYTQYSLMQNQACDCPTN